MLIMNLMKFCLSQLDLNYVIHTKIEKIHKNLSEIESQAGPDVEEQIEQMNFEIKEIEQKTPEEKMHDLYLLLGVDSLQYKKKMTGIVLPFNTREKDLRISANDSIHTFRRSPLKNLEQVKKDVALIKKKREEMRKKKEMEKIQQYEKNRKILRKIFEQQYIERFGEPLNEKNASVLQPRATRQNPAFLSVMKRPRVSPDDGKLTWKKLQDLSLEEAGTEFKIDSLLPNEPEDEELMKRLVIPQNSRSEMSTRLPPLKSTPKFGRNYLYQKYSLPAKSVERPQFSTIESSSIPANEISLNLQPIQHPLSHRYQSPAPRPLKNEYSQRYTRNDLMLRAKVMDDMEKSKEEKHLNQILSL